MNIKRVLFFTIVLGVLVSGCGKKSIDINSLQSVDVQGEATADLIQDEDLLASDLAVVINIDTINKEVTLQKADTGERYVLAYDGRTNFSDKYGQVLTAAEVVPGEIVDISLSLHSKLLKDMQIAEDSFILRSVESHEINEHKGMFSVGRDNYRLPKDLVVVMGNQVGSIEDIISNDILTVKGVGRDIYSVTIDKGHGYLNLSGAESFVGGWIEVDNIIKPISEKMLLLLPEGEHDVRVSYHGKGGTRSVSIKRDKETDLNVASLESELLQKGEVAFIITPFDAVLKINGQAMQHLLPIELEYGVYNIQVSAKGYETVNEYISVGKDTAELEIELVELSGEKDSSSTNKSTSTSSSSTTAPALSSNNTASANNSLSNNTASEEDLGEEEPVDISKEETGAKLHVDDPQGVEVYYDGAYKGMSPISFSKGKGNHVITLRKRGYMTKSYTVEIDDDDRDEFYSFADMEEE